MDSRFTKLKFDVIPIRNIIWDLDGTLFNTWPECAKAYRNAMNDLGINCSLNWIHEELSKIPYRHRLIILAKKFTLDSNVIEKAFRKHYSNITAEECPPFAGVRNICVFILSNNGKNVIVTNREKKGTLNLLSAHKMTDYFSGVISKDDGYPGKPDPAAINAVIDRYELDRNQTICIGDRESDIAAGQDAGVISYLFNNDPNRVTADLDIYEYSGLYQALLDSNI